MPLKSGQLRKGLRNTSTGVEIPDSVVSRPQDDNNTSVTDIRGLRFTALSNLSKIEPTISANSSGYSTAYLQTTGGSVLDSTDISSLSSGDSFELVASLSSSTQYDVVMDNSGSSWTLGFYGSASYPYSADDIELNTAVFGSGTNDTVAYSFVSVGAYVD